MRRKTTEEFIEDAKKIHGDRYDYSLTDYINNTIKVKIICSIHGEFEQNPNSHLKGSICHKCSVESRSSNTLEFIKKSELKHNYKYNYSLTTYKSAHYKVKIICPIHGIFEQKPSNHLNSGGCTKCNKAFKLTTTQFIEKSTKIHNNKFDYSLTKYKNNRTKVKIICPIHGTFEQNPANHLNGMGCRKCDVLNRTITKEEFIEKSNIIHNNKYNYSLVNYKNTETKVKIICSTHGIFEQTPNNHTSQKQGCPICKESRGEKEISEILKKLNIKFEREYKFEKCKNKNHLPFDFYLSDYNICIEFDGSQHFNPNEFFGGVKGFKKLIENDKIKNEYCKNNNIRLIRIKYDDDIYLSIINELIKF